MLAATLGAAAFVSADFLDAELLLLVMDVGLGASGFLAAAAAAVVVVAGFLAAEAAGGRLTSGEDEKIKSFHLVNIQLLSVQRFNRYSVQLSVQLKPAFIFVFYFQRYTREQHKHCLERARCEINRCEITVDHCSKKPW